MAVHVPAAQAGLNLLHGFALLHMFQASINMHQHLYLSLKLSNAISADTPVGKHAENNE